MRTHYKGTPQEIRSLGAYIKLSRAVQSVKTRIEAHHTVEGLTQAQFGTLEMLYHVGSLTQKEIGEKLLYSKSNIVAVVDALEAGGMVQRVRDAEDRRYVNVSITDQGQRRIEEILPAHVAAITEELSCLTAGELDELARLCRKLGLNES